jgi:hypothetical protein
MLGRSEGNQEEAAATNSIPRRLHKWKIETGVSPAVFAIPPGCGKREVTTKTLRHQDSEMAGLPGLLINTSSSLGDFVVAVSFSAPARKAGSEIM